MSVTIVYDCVGSALGSFPIPSGVLMAGYMTGSGNVPWTQAQFWEHPGAIHIDQSSYITGLDETADVLDFENGAAILSDLKIWVAAAQANFKSVTRAGQRKPVIYMSADNVTSVVNELVGAGITSGVGLWVANWNLTDPQATTDVNDASGPFPIVGVQFSNQGSHDISVFSTAWLQEVSEVATPNPPVTGPNPVPVPTPVPGIQPNWHHCLKCQSLFYYPGEANSVCPSGGTHDGSKSHDYVVVFMD